MERIARDVYRLIELDSQQFDESYLLYLFLINNDRIRTIEYNTSFDKANRLFPEQYSIKIKRNRLPFISSVASFDETPHIIRSHDRYNSTLPLELGCFPSIPSSLPVSNACPLRVPSSLYLQSCPPWGNTIIRRFCFRHGDG